MQFLNYDSFIKGKGDWESTWVCVKKQLHPEPNAGCVTLGSKNYNQALAELVIAVEKFCPTLFFLHICFTSAILGGFFSINGLFTVVKNPISIKCKSRLWLDHSKPFKPSIAFKHWCDVLWKILLHSPSVLDLWGTNGCTFSHGIFW